MKINEYQTKADLRRIVMTCREKMPHCRYGQAFINRFPEFEPEDRKYCCGIWEDDNLNSVVFKIQMILQLNGAFERI